MKKVILFLISFCSTIMLNAQVSKSITVSAGALFSSLSYSERKSVNDLTITCTLDARDFKTMRDEMPELESIDLTGVIIAEYTGEEGTGYEVNYPANSLPERAFSNSSSEEEPLLLKNIMLPPTLTTIGSNAFQYCINLQSIILPPSVNIIGEYAFYGCFGLTQLTIPSSVTSIGEYAFFECSGLTMVTLPSSLTKIRGYTFSHCNGLLLLTIPSSVTEIGMYAFEGCSGLTGIIIPPLVASLGRRAFYNCSGLTSITIPPSVTSLGEETFLGCSSLISVDLPLSITAIGTNEFSGCTALTSFIIPSSVTSIGELAFGNCKSLSSITIPSSVTTIGKLAFEGCSGIDSVFIPSSVTAIGVSAFRNCIITIDENNNSYSSLDGIFYNKTKTHLIECSSLLTGNFIIPYSVTTIEGNAFNRCNGLTSITIPASVTTIENNAFLGYNGLIVIEEANPNYSIMDGVLYNKDKTVLIKCPGSKTGSFVIPSSVTSIGIKAFYYCKGLSAISIPQSVTSIGVSAFEGCQGLTSIDLPTSLTSIGEDVFDFCTGLTDIVIPSSVTSIGNYAFGFCDITSVIIPTSVTSIGNHAFTWCDMTSVIIPNSVMSIDYKAFDECHKLTSVTLSSSLTYLGFGAFRSCYNLKSIYSNMVDPVGIDWDTFYGVDFDNCILYVPYLSYQRYSKAYRWSDFKNIREMPGFLTDVNVLTIGAAKNSTAAVWIRSNTTWSATSNQTWLTISDGSINGDGTLSLIADSNPTVSKREATVTISATGVDSQYITVKQEATTGVDILTEISKKVQVYPNPAKDALFICGFEGVTTLNLTDLNGKVLLTKEIIENENISINTLSRGVYILKIATKNGSFEKKLLKE